MCVFVCSLVADKAPILALNCLMQTVNSESDDSGDALAERYISFKTKTYCHFSLIVQASLI